MFDGGAGCGRFSILLARHGCEVTHFDISQPMIEKAKELADREGVLDRITFIRGHWRIWMISKITLLTW